MALGDLVGLEHVPVISEWGEDERVSSIPVLLEGRRVYFLSPSFLGSGDSPGVVAPGCVVEPSQVAERCFVSSRYVSWYEVGFAFTCSKRQLEVGAARGGCE